MSGIAGIYNVDGCPVDRDLLNRMTDRIRHRGQDDGGIWVDGYIGLGHHQLWTTEESYREKQPLSNRDGTCWITCDGRVDNREELIWKLKGHVNSPEYLTDTEVILCAYEVWGTDCLHKIIGPFAFAIWDTRRHELFCARDPIGRRNLFYYFDGNKFLWGSEIKPLLQDPEVPRSLNDIYILDLLMRHPVDREITPYQNILRLLHGHYLIIGKRGLQKQQYWDIDPRWIIRYKADSEYAEHFQDLFREAVRCRMRARGPLAATLSGGLDSSSVVCMAQEIYREQAMPYNGFETFSFIFDKISECDERRFIQKIVKKYGIHAHYILGDELWALKDWHRHHSLYKDEPFHGMLDALNRAVLQRIHEASIRVVLDGEGGDSFLTGNRYYLADLLRLLKVGELANELKCWAEGSTRSLLRILVNDCLTPLLPASILSLSSAFGAIFRKVDREKNGVLPPPGRAAPWIDPHLVMKIGPYNKYQETQCSRRFRSLSMQTDYEAIAGEAIYSVVDQHVALPLSIETRSPFLDQRLIEFSVTKIEQASIYLK